MFNVFRRRVAENCRFKRAARCIQFQARPAHSNGISSNGVDAMTNAIPFEEALGELQQIVSALESGHVNLEQSLSQFEKGIGLISHCRALLDQAHQRVEIVVSRSLSVEPVTTPFDPTATFSTEAATEAATDPESGSSANGTKSRRRRADPDQRGLFT